MGLSMTRLHLRDHRFDWRHHRTHQVAGYWSTPPQPLPVSNPDVLDWTALSCGGGGSSLRGLPGDRSRRVDLVVHLVASAKRQRSARAQRPQADVSADFLDVRMN